MMLQQRRAEGTFSEPGVYCLAVAVGIGARLRAVGGERGAPRGERGGGLRGSWQPHR